MTTSQYDTHTAFVGSKSGVMLCGNCVVDGCEPVPMPQGC